MPVPSESNVFGLCLLHDPSGGPPQGCALGYTKEKGGRCFGHQHRVYFSGMEAIPSVIAILTCEKIIIEQGSNKKSLIGVFGQLLTPQVPVVGSFGFYARLTDAEGDYTFKVEIVYANENKPIVRFGTELLQVTDRLGFVELALSVPPVSFPSFGRYELQLYGNEVYLGHVTIDVIQPTETSHGNV